MSFSCLLGFLQLQTKQKALPDYTWRCCCKLLLKYKYTEEDDLKISKSWKKTVQLQGILSYRQPLSLQSWKQEYIRSEDKERCVFLPHWETTHSIAIVRPFLKEHFSEELE